MEEFISFHSYLPAGHTSCKLKSSDSKINSSFLSAHSIPSCLTMPVWEKSSSPRNLTLRQDTLCTLKGMRVKEIRSFCWRIPYFNIQRWLSRRVHLATSPSSQTRIVNNKKEKVQTGFNNSVHTFYSCLATAGDYKLNIFFFFSLTFLSSPELNEAPTDDEVSR